MEMVAKVEDVWTNPSGTLKGVGPGTELDWYVQRLRANQSNVVKVDLCKQMLGPEGTRPSLFIVFIICFTFNKGKLTRTWTVCAGAREIMEALENSTTACSVLLGADEIGPEGARAGTVSPAPFSHFVATLTAHAPPHTCATDRPRRGAVGQALLKNRSLKTVFLVCAPHHGPPALPLPR
jgi:hypothetical protein